MIVPDRLDLWYAEAVLRVYGPWLTSACVGISERQRREIAELIDRARRAAALPPLESLPASPSHRAIRPVAASSVAPSSAAVPPVAAPDTFRPAAARRTLVGRWDSAAA